MLRFGTYQLDAVQGLRRGGEELRVTPKSLAVLLFLAERAGNVVTKAELFQSVWRGTVVSDSALTSCIQELRHVLEDDARLPRYVETLHRRGYRFVASVSLEEESSTSKVSLPIATDGPFVGRDAAIQQMLASWSQAQRGSRQMLFVTGEAGIGKSAIVSAFLQNISGTTRISWTQCVQHFGVGEAYEPLLDAITRLCRQPGASKTISILERYGPTWLAQLPALVNAERYAALQKRFAGTTRERMFRELTNFMEATTEEVPLILWLEDLHWSDRSTLEWIAAFAQRPEPARLLLIGTFRPAAVADNNHPLSALFRELRSKRFCREIPLAGLNESALVEYIEARFPGATDPTEHAAQLVSRIHKRTGGNPLFVINVLGDLVERQLLFADQGHWKFHDSLSTQDLGIPEDIRRAIDSQISRLAPDELTLLEVASVAGLTFAASTVAAVTETTESLVERIFSPISQQLRFIRPTAQQDASEPPTGDKFEFLHVLYRDALYRRLSPIRLRELHRKVGRSMEEAFGERAGEIAAELAMHFEQGQDIPRALLYLEKAALNARNRSAFTEARMLLEHAVRLLEDQPSSVERSERQAVLLTGLGGVIMATQGWGAREAEEAYSRAWALRQTLGESTKLFPALWGLWLFYWGRGMLGIAGEVAEDLLVRGRRAGNPALLLQAHHAAWATAFSCGDLDATMSHTEQGLQLYDADPNATAVADFGNHDTGACCRMFRARALALLGRTEEAIRVSSDSVAHARNLAHPFSQALTLVFAAGMNHVLRDPTVAKAHAAAASAIARDQGFKLMLAWASALEGWVLTEEGFNDEGLDQITASVIGARTIGSSQFQPHLLGILAEAHLKSGGFTAGLRAIDEAMVALEGGERFYEAELRRLRGELLLEKDSTLTAEAEECFLQALKIATSHGASLFALRAAISLGRLFGRLGRQADARKFLTDARKKFPGIVPSRDLTELKSLLPS